MLVLNISVTSLYYSHMTHNIYSQPLNYKIIINKYKLYSFNSINLIMTMSDILDK